MDIEVSDSGEAGEGALSRGHRPASDFDVDPELQENTKGGRPHHLCAELCRDPWPEHHLAGADGESNHYRTRARQLPKASLPFGKIGITQIRNWKRHRLQEFAKDGEFPTHSVEIPPKRH